MCQGWRVDEKNQGQPPVPSLTLLGQTGILIRAGEYHCFILPGKPNAHTHSHTSLALCTQSIQREVEAQIMRRCVCALVYTE